MTGVCIRRWNFDTERDTRGVCTQRKAHVRHCKRWPSAKARNQACRHLDLRHLASRTVRKYISVVWAIQSVVFCYGGPSKPRWDIRWFSTAQSFTTIILVHGDGFVSAPITTELCITVILVIPLPHPVFSLLHLWLDIFSLTRLSTTPGHNVYRGLSAATMNMYCCTDNMWVKLVLISKFPNKSIPFVSDKIKGLFIQKEKS